MKLGLGMSSVSLSRDNLRYAKQAGVTHITLHTSELRRKDEVIPKDPPGYTGEGAIWTVEDLLELKRMVNEEGLTLEALENYNPAFWYDILLDGPKKQQQMENLKTLIRNVGKAGIPIFGYYFSIAGVWGRVWGPFARGGAEVPAYQDPEQTPVPNGWVWGSVYDRNPEPGFLEPVLRAEMWQRMHYYLSNLLPVAEEAGVVLAAHPDDPPMPALRGTERLIYQPDYYEKLFNLVPSPNNQAELCVGTLAEMSNDGFYEAIETYAAMGKIAYVHLRNVRGKVPNYTEVFIDEGDTDILRVLSILHRNHFQGVIIPDHAPHMTCPAPWHAGMAFALGYLRAGMTVVERGWGEGQ
jgi:mannonate dehydratase